LALAPEIIEPTGFALEAGDEDRADGIVCTIERVEGGTPSFPLLHKPQPHERRESFTGALRLHSSSERELPASYRLGMLRQVAQQPKLGLDWGIRQDKGPAVTLAR
jgi:hypothetical protein